MAISVRLSGFNIDADLLTQTTELLRLLKQKTDSGSSSITATDAKELVDLIQERLSSDISLEAFTPETLSAAYARISRDPKHVTELRRAARFSVARARKSNENIIFGLGHSSVAEHAAFNFDISGLSRLASEVLQSHRLLSFTEKSQRYITIGEDFVIPPEILESKWETTFREFVPQLFAGYTAVYEALREKLLPEDTTGLKKSEINLLEGRAKEDARYLLPLACTTQMGVTMNARNAEHVLAEFSDHPLQEIQELGAKISRSISGLAPSLVKYTKRGSYPRENQQQIALLVDGTANNSAASESFFNGPSVRVLESTPNGEEKVLQALAFSHGRVKWNESNPKEAIWKELYRGMTQHDSVPREFELASITFEAEVSAACFGQLKRHRMMTLISQDYAIEDGTVVPPSITEAGLDGLFRKKVRNSYQLATELRDYNSLLTSYLLTNAHRRRVVMQVNARELYHFARLRSDAHAQWEIRMLSDMMIEEAVKLWPNTMMLACGKDRFEEQYRSIFGQ